MSFISWYAVWSGRHDTRLLHLPCPSSGCWTFHISCQTACRPLNHVTLFDLAFEVLHFFELGHVMLCCYVAFPTIRLLLVMWSCLHDTNLLNLLCLMLRFLTFPVLDGALSSRCCAAWTSLSHTWLLHKPPYLMLLGALSLYQMFAFRSLDVVFMVLNYLI